MFDPQAEGTLSRDGEAVGVSPQARQILRLLIERRGTPVRFVELQAAAGSVNADLGWLMSHLRRETGVVIKSVRGVGYRLESTVLAENGMPRLGTYVPEAHRAALGIFGGGSCLIRPELRATWTPLKADCVSPENLVPLSAGYSNDWIRRQRLGDTGVAELRKLSGNAFDRGEFRRSYGLGRLALALLTSIAPNAKEAIEVACYSLTSLRSSPVVACVQDTLSSLASILAKIQRKRLAPDVAVRVASELAALYRDHDNAARAIEILGLTRVRNAIANCERLSDQQAARALHCSASAAVMLGRSDADGDLERSLQLSAEGGFHFGVSNVLVTRIERALLAGKLSDAEVYLNEAFEMCGGLDVLLAVQPPDTLGTVSWGKAIELLTLSSELAVLQARYDLGEQHAHKAIALSLQAGAHLRPSFYARLRKAAPGAASLVSDRVRSETDVAPLDAIVHDLSRWLAG